MLVAILANCVEGGPDDDEEAENKKEAEKTGTAIGTIEEEKEKRREVIRNKIRAVGKVNPKFQINIILFF